MTGPSHKKIGHTGRLRFKRQEQRQPCSSLHQRTGQRDEGSAIEVRQPTHREGQNHLQQPLGALKKSDGKCQNRFMAIDEGQIQGKFRGKTSIFYNIIKPLENLGEVIEEDSHLVISSYL